MGEAPSRRTWRSRLRGLLFKAVLCYLGVLILLLFLENFLLFPATRASSGWLPAPSSRFQDIELTSADGTRIHAWWLPVAGSKGALLYCHGNAGNLSFRGFAMQQLAMTLGESVLIFDYPGYGKSEGRPSEKTCYAAADAAYEWLTRSQKIAGENIILYGKSLGGGVAVELATRRPHRALVLAKTFTSIPELAQEMYFFLPAKLLVRNRFDNLSKIGTCPRPVFIAYGDCDSLVGKHHAQKLFEAANEPKHLQVMAGCGHNDPLPTDCLDSLKQFVERYTPLRQAERVP